MGIATVSLYSMPNVTVNSYLFTPNIKALTVLSFTQIVTPYKITNTCDGDIHAKAQHLHVLMGLGVLPLKSMTQIP